MGGRAGGEASASARRARWRYVLGPLGSFYMSSQTAMQGVFVALAVGAIAGIVPAWNGARLNVTEALRRLF